MTEQAVQTKNASARPTLELCRSLLQESPQLWPLASQYLFDFTSLADRERLKHVIAPLDLRLLATGSPCRERLVRFAETNLGITPFFHAFPKDDGSRILLIPPEQFLLLAEWLGTLSYEACLRRTIQGSAIKAVKQSLPHAFPVLYRRSYRYAPWRSRLQASIGEAPHPLKDASNVLKHGLRLLATILSPLPQALRQRMMMRFPAQFDPCFAPLSSWDFQDDDLKLLFTVLEQECPQGWKICCF